MFVKDFNHQNYITVLTQLLILVQVYRSSLIEAFEGDNSSTLGNHYFKPFYGIPAAFGYLNLDKRTDIVAIGGDGKRVDIYYQEAHVANFTRGYSCHCDKQIAQIYLTDVERPSNPKLLLLLIHSKSNDKTLYSLQSLVIETLDFGLDGYGPTKLDSNSVYTIATASKLTSISKDQLSHDSNNEEPHRHIVEPCKLNDLDIMMESQPLLFDFNGDLKTDIMSVDREGNVAIWIAEKEYKTGVAFTRQDLNQWNNISSTYFNSPHSNSFIDMDGNGAADIVLKSGSRVLYAYSTFNSSTTFRNLREFPEFDDGNHYGQSSLVDIDADGIIDHIIPRCSKFGCEIIVLENNSRKETIFRFHETPFTLEEIKFSDFYNFPVMLRSGDLDGDGFVDFVVVAKDKSINRNQILYLRNIEITKDSDLNDKISKKRTFEIIKLDVVIPQDHEIKLAIPFDIDEDGKLDLLIGSSGLNVDPQNMLITAQINTRISTGFFMKVLVTNGHSNDDSSAVGYSAIGPSVCFELSQNNGKVMKGCAGQMAQLSHFSLHLPYTIFGLGQTPHFVEKLNVSIPGYSKCENHDVRRRVFDQIVPDAQIIVVPSEIENPMNWEYKLFLSPMSDLAVSTGMALGVIFIVLVIAIIFLHRRETLEDEAEHEEYKRHWPESR